jgi:hypothetical protein
MPAYIEALAIQAAAFFFLGAGLDGGVVQNGIFALRFVLDYVLLTVFMAPLCRSWSELMEIFRCRPFEFLETYHARPRGWRNISNAGLCK